MKLLEKIICWLQPKYNKKGALEIETLIKWGIVLIILVVLVVAATTILKGKGGRLIDTIKDSLRFGG
jgi:hypothetical protein